MTLIQTVTTDDLVIQVADRRLSRPDGSVFDDDYTKLVCWNTSFTVGFTGLARIDPAQKKSTSEWLAETLCDYASFEDGVDALRYWASGQIGQLPTGKGWEDKTARDYHRRLRPPQDSSRRRDFELRSGSADPGQPKRVQVLPNPPSAGALGELPYHGSCVD